VPNLVVPWGTLGTEAPAARRVQTLAELYPRICVRDPYFALQDVTVVGRGEVVARVPVQLDPGAEASPIAIAEAGRHLAILGSCAASQVAPKDGQHYYLACAARGEWLHQGPLPHGTKMLWGAAQARFTGKRSVTARTVLSTTEGLPFFSLDVDYNVLTSAAFVRLFSDARVDMRQQPRAERPKLSAEEIARLRQNPYCQPLALRDFVRDGDCMKASLQVTANMCKGHFALHPVMPVAIVASGMTRVAGAMLGAHVGNAQARYMTRKVNLRAESLAYAGQVVNFGAHRRESHGREHTFYCFAAVGERVVAELDITYVCAE
jgi:3-hydroxymyristoyl/3-hydroxydecanoyl-(acyl carrier protein) dehydratase